MRAVDDVYGRHRGVLVEAEWKSPPDRLLVSAGGGATFERGECMDPNRRRV